MYDHPVALSQWLGGLTVKPDEMVQKPNHMAEERHTVREISPLRIRIGRYLPSLEFASGDRQIEWLRGTRRVPALGMVALAGPRC